MKAIVLLLALASAAIADAYTPIDWLEVTERAGIGFYFDEEEGGYKVMVGPVMGRSGCLAVGNFTINDRSYFLSTTKWQMRKERVAWSDVSGTARTSGVVCGLPSDVPSGEYRLVAEVEVDGVTEKYASRNTLVVAGDPETAVEAVTWGALKSRTTR